MEEAYTPSVVISSSRPTIPAVSWPTIPSILIRFLPETFQTKLTLSTKP